MSKAPVLIAGAGPTGLVLALSLRKNGVPVRIIDKEPHERLGERGPGVAPRTFELHRILGTSDDIMAAAKPIYTNRYYDPTDSTKPLKTFEMAPYVEPTPHIPYNNPLMLGQNHHEAILRTHLATFGTTVEWASELKSFTQSADSVVAEIVHRDNDTGKETIEKVEVPYLFGADGAHSIVRKTLGLQFLGETREGEHIVIGDIKLLSEPREYWERWRPQKKMVALRPSSQDKTVLNFVLAGDIDAAKILASRESIVEEIYEINGRRDIVFGDLIWKSSYRPNIRMVNKLGAGRVFIGGDAAHCHSPVGGQGLNSSVQDAFNFGWKLALAYKGIASPTLLDTYQEERIPIIAEMLDKTTELYEKARASSGDLKRSEDLKQLGVNYRGSSIVIEDASADAPDAPGVKWPGYNKESETAARAGDRAPEAPGLKVVKDGTTTSFFNLFSPSKHTLLVFSSSTDEQKALSDILKGLPIAGETVQTVLVLKKDDQAGPGGPVDIAVADEQGYAFAGYHIDGAKSCFIVVRPDGAIGARVSSVAGVEKYFKGIFKA